MSCSRARGHGPSYHTWVADEETLCEKLRNSVAPSKVLMYDGPSPHLQQRHRLGCPASQPAPSIGAAATASPSTQRPARSCTQANRRPLVAKHTHWGPQPTRAMPSTSACGSSPAVHACGRAPLNDGCHKCLPASRFRGSCTYANAVPYRHALCMY